MADAAVNSIFAEQKASEATLMEFHSNNNSDHPHLTLFVRFFVSVHYLGFRSFSLYNTFKDYSTIMPR